MKRIFCCILIIFMLPISFIFIGCEEKKSRTLLEFYTNYLKIADSSQYLEQQAIPESFNASTEIKKVGFIYSTDLQEKIANIKAFGYLEEFYNTMLDDAMGPTYLFGNTLISAKLDNKEKAELYSILDELKEDYLQIANRLGDLERTQNDGTALQNLSKLYSSYDAIIETATQLSAKISSIYYNQILTTSNPDYINMKNSSINLTSLASRTLNRLTYYKSIYVDIFYQTQIKGYNIAENLINGVFTGSYTPYDSFKNNQYVSSNLNSNLEDYRGDLVVYARSLYLIQKDFDTEYAQFKTASSQITYCKVNENSNQTEIGLKTIVDKFANSNGIAYSSYEIVKSILDICYL